MFAAIDTTAVKILDISVTWFQIRVPLGGHDEKPIVFTYTACLVMLAVQTSVPPAGFTGSGVD